MSNGQSQEQDLFADVERAKDTPIILCPYGVKKEQFDGKTYLVAMTRDELITCIEKAESKDRAAAEQTVAEMENNKAGRCYQTDGCVQTAGCQNCQSMHGAGGFWCYCTA